MFVPCDLDDNIMEEPEFFKALMWIWLGQAPADYKLKEALLAGK